MTSLAARDEQYEPPREDILGVAVSAVSPRKALDVVLSWVSASERNYVTVTGVHGIIEAQSDPDFKRILCEAKLTVPDGMPLVWLCRLFGRNQTARVFGPDFMLMLSEALARIGGRAFYYGGAPGVADELAAEMESRYPGLVNAGTHCPPYRQLTETEIAEVVETINRARPDVVWVGLSTPKQERWMATVRHRLNAPVLIGVGAAFDYNTGRIKRAPKWMQASALEWLYRLIQEPRRLWRRYLRNNTLFIALLVYEWLGLRKFDQP